MKDDRLNSAQWKSEIEALKRRVAASENRNELTAFYGSSSIRLWNTMKKDLSPHPVINLGFGGSTYQWCNYFFDQVFAGLSPTRIILYAGDNDLGTGENISKIITDVQVLLMKIKKAYGDTSIAIISVKPSPHRLSLRNSIGQLNKELKAAIQEVGNGTYIDVYSKMLSKDGDFREELFAADMLHMNDKGYSIWRKVVGSYLDQQRTS